MISFLEKILNVFKNAKGSDFSEECGSIDEKTQNVHMTGFLKEKYRYVYRKKILIFRGIARSSKLAAEIDWNSEISQNAQKLSFHKKLDIFRKKNLNDSKITKGRIFSVGCKWNDKIPQNARNLGFFIKKNTVFFEKESWIS